ncbi:MAG: glycoside hydrolase family protein [Clostridia bacterium]|jgi:unsaturated rhamnogalacturonyl hydrolase|nr:glycoside hydrolase family protein [Clostridia bacterium]
MNNNIKKDKIRLVMQNLVNIEDASGEFLLHFGDLIVDDKSWNVWNWPQGVGLYGIYRYWQATEEKEALKIVTDWFDKQFEEGLPPKNVNTMAPLLTLAYLYETLGNDLYGNVLVEWCEWVMNEMPRTNEGGLQHMTYGPENRNQLWDDTLMMTVLPLAKTGMLFNKKEYIEEAKRQFLIHMTYLMDKKSGLWYHGWTFEENHNYAKAFWARGNCWITMAIPEIINILELKEGDFFRTFLLDVLNKQIQTLVEYQDETGLWHTLVDDKSSYLETSASSGFAYGILKAVKAGYIERQYKNTGDKAIKGLINKINPKGGVEGVSVGTGMGATKDFYKNIGITEMPYGQSLMVLSLSEALDKEN